jgi:hypothetical protein
VAPVVARPGLAPWEPLSPRAALLFTDDDVEVDSPAVAAGLEHLDTDHDHAWRDRSKPSSPTYNPLCEHSVEDHVGGSFLDGQPWPIDARLLFASAASTGFSPRRRRRSRSRVENHRRGRPRGLRTGDERPSATGRPYDARGWIRRGRPVLDDRLLPRSLPATAGLAANAALGAGERAQPDGGWMSPRSGGSGVRRHEALRWSSRGGRPC